MRKIIFASAFSGLLTACASTIQPQHFTGPNGRDAYAMRSSGLGRTLEKCYQKAGQVCPEGYDIIGQQTGTVAVPTYYGAVAAPQHNLTIECR